MSRTYRAGLALTGLLCVSVPAAADGPLPRDGSALRWRWEEPENHSGHTVEVRFARGGAGVTVQWGTARRTFDAAVATELRRTWGGRRFDLRGWPDAMDCQGTVVWTVEGMGGRHTLCHDGPEERRLANFASTVQVLMSAPP